MGQAQVWKSESKKIVLTNGCFDIVHQGHVDFLYRAADLGDVLIVAVNTNASAARLGKGPHRPIQDEAARAAVMAGFAPVAAVTLFDEDTPYILVRDLEPDVLVKGGDYALTDIVGHDLQLARGAEVLSLPLLEGFSTTAIEQKIIKSSSHI